MTSTQTKPWYKEPWPWAVIGLTGSAVVASLITLAIAIKNPDALVVSDQQYQEMRDDLRPSGHEPKKPDEDKPGGDG